MMLLNCQSLTGNKADYLASEFVYGRSRVGFLCLTETNVSDESIKFIHFPGFTEVSSFNRTKHKSGGVGLWARDDLDCHSLNLKAFCVERHFEVCGMSWRANNGRTVVVIVCYRSPHVGDTDVFCDGLTRVLDRTYKPNVDIILMGDFNLDPTRDARDFNKLVDVVQGYNLKFLITQPTRGKYILDHVCSNMFLNCQVEECCISDHRYVLVNVLGCELNSSTDMASYGRDFHPDKIMMFHRSLLNESWNTVFTKSTVDDCFSSFLDIFLYHFNVYFPIKSYTKRGSKPWVTEEVRISSKALKEMFCLAKNNPSLSDSYKQAKRKHLKLLQVTKSNFYQDKIFKSENMTKSAWRVIKELGNHKKSQ